jgi:hypothetical protein
MSRDLIQASVAAISRYSPATSRLISCINSMVSTYCSAILAIGMSVTSTSLRRMRWSSRSSGPSKMGKLTA